MSDGAAVEMRVDRHTPGPWRAAPLAADADVPWKDGFVVVAGGGADDEPVEDVAYTSPCEDGEHAANAALLAAAPSLLAAARAALPLVEGCCASLCCDGPCDDCPPDEAAALRAMRDAIALATPEAP